MRAQREIDVTYARQEADRATKLLTAGAASQMDADRAANALKAAEAQLRTVEEQIRTSRTDLAYYRVTSPTAGIVGDIPVREGDRVTKATLLTTVDANVGLEVYINVPVQQAPKLKPGLTVRLVDESGPTDRRREDQFHLAVRRHADADRAGENAGDGAGQSAHRSIRARAGDLVDRAGADDSGDVGHAHQRSVVRVRRRARRRRQRAGRATARGALGPVVGNNYTVVERIEARRETDRRGHSEDQGRRAGQPPRAQPSRLHLGRARLQSRARAP